MKNFRTGSGYDKKQEIEKKLKEKRTEAQRIEALEKEAKQKNVEKMPLGITWKMSFIFTGGLIVVMGILILVAFLTYDEEADMKKKHSVKVFADSQEMARKINARNHALFIQTDEYKALQKKKEAEKLLKIEKESILFNALEDAKKIVRMSIVRHGETVGCKLIYYDEFFRWEAFDNPKGKGTIIVHFGYEVWLFVNGKLYPINGSAHVVTPEFPYSNTLNVPYTKGLSRYSVDPYITKKHETSLQAIVNIKQSIDETYRHKGLDNPI